ncbi:flagellar basal body-associated protein FliL [Pseudoalteromonas sp. SR44-5]|jgi:flagellar FliL protein|uniref:Flagellar protein FliL n=2 Tax=Pseudoalteromonas TaxID=53246 RepID=A0ABY3FG46_9GAMM|nr:MULTISPECIES: flagellar basal body-associated protein FliL [Pseudoalteromonas]MBB1293989.1 flagellar basal body-associated protein FliL [Pseudoalteromonas sp. SR41-4]MBB1301990.1 flagellar basal body-associated protein FliL [Pseudoalteromonas sp. SR44-8]MBB1310549.1 flagellar basal body-associated protein FliL [Pseudoalteromonas sp. SR41-8]MBB1333707.1 flagellar basal body-associated protein FliL [Pseudoalteromonas sp. SR41-6]MBB1341764.1 flagellar basal body-associated protein FliL [Pseudo|tara:strand:- start:14410 stop:14817 length:408 start_codon:yes stop_codon:yes gene_type:complete
MKKTLYAGILISTFFISLFSSFASKAESTVGYFGFEPDIITNYIGQSNKKLGYVRITVDLMLSDMSNIAIVEHHTPLLRDALVEILSKEPEEKIKSLTGREEIRKRCAEKLKTLLKQETGQEIIREVLFTKYLYH